MKFFILVGQPKSDASPTVLECMDADTHAFSSMHLDGMKAKYERSGEFDRLVIMPVELDPLSIRRALYPEEFADNSNPMDNQASGEEIK